MSKVQFKTLFKKSWLNHEDFKNWLLEDVDKDNFKCKWCGDDTPMALSNIQHGYKGIEIAQYVEKTF